MCVRLFAVIGRYVVGPGRWCCGWLAGWLTVNFIAREMSQWPCDVVCVWSSPGRADFGGAGDM